MRRWARGTRVRVVEAALFMESDSFEDIPGTVVEHDMLDPGPDATLVLWDDGRMSPILSENLQELKPAEDIAQVISKSASLKFSRGDWERMAFPLFTSTPTGGVSSELVHKATQDLWSFQTDDSGSVTLTRLFDDDGVPLKI